MCQTAEKIKLFNFPSNTPAVMNGNHPIRVLFLTSLRDVALCDLNGSEIITPNGTRYMEGVIERTATETQVGGSLHGLIQIAGVVTDDTSRDTKGYPTEPTKGKPWIYPDLALPQGASLWQVTRHIPSTFRQLPLSDTEGRKRLKQEFELRILSLMQELGAQVLISDHYMALVEFLFPPVLQFGRVINIHPAVTLSGHPCCFTGKTPTADAIAAAQTRTVTTGATLHIVDPIIDHGPAIAYSEDTLVHPTDEPKHLRYRNYQQGKLPVFISGVKHYARNIFPNLASIDFSQYPSLMS